ncbi:hypothetical protein VKT23_009536 [Stygiomarasmius scandens]|uniref:Enoyl reductase (ER) domain-containing protein n=1 Tax=Marasmiellus scandens TaxID=2682957 RepID=A0ABR1JEP3_9AGAR
MSQKALLLQSKGGTFAVKTIPKPIPALKGELLVKVQASALNPVDWKIQTYGWFVSDEDYPVILGVDVAGDVEDVGEGVVGFKKGDRVLFNAIFRNEYAGHQQFTRVPADIVAKIPANLSYSQASTIPLGYLTAALGLYADAPIGLGLNPTFASDSKNYHGKVAVVIGGSTSVGQYAIQLLKYLGFSTIIAYASTHHFPYLKSLGATDFIDRKAISFSDISAAVKKITTSPVEVVYDAISEGGSQQAAYNLLPNGGQLVITLPDEIRDKIEGDGKRVVHVYANAHLDFNRGFASTAFEKLPKLLEEGIIVPNKVEDLPGGLEGIVDGLNKLKNNQVSGVKLVAHPQD